MASFTVFYNPNLPWQEEFWLLDEDDSVSDITGASFRMHVRQKLDAPEILAIASTENGKIINSERGIIVSLSSIDTMRMATAAFTCFSDLEITYPSGKIIPEIINLEFKLNKSYTRDFDTK